MVKYARMVFEVKVEDNESEEEVLDAMESTLINIISNGWGMDDIEIHDKPYKESK